MLVLDVEPVLVQADRDQEPHRDAHQVAQDHLHVRARVLEAEREPVSEDTVEHVDENRVQSDGPERPAVRDLLLVDRVEEEK